MENIPVDLRVTGLQSKMLKDYLEGNPQLKKFYQWNPSFDAFADVIEARKKVNTNRSALHNELVKQHDKYYFSYPEILENVDSLLSENTFTVTTGHQLCIATGPLYFLYKIITTINLCKELKEKFPENNFVPVYWMASEDHDFEEINHIHLFGKQLKWNQDVKGATGKIPTVSLTDFLNELKAVLGESEAAASVMQLMNDSYSANKTLADATRDLVIALFGKAGLLVLDADRPELKKIFIPIVKKELEEQRSFDLVMQNNKELENDYHLPVTPRPINLFFLEDGVRERIVKAPDGHYEVVNTDLTFTEKFLEDLLLHQPERFSPNVVLRPVYQELILPNLAYVGGPGETSYWLQLKSVFDHYGVFYPMLVPRNHAMIIGKKQLQKFHALGFKTEDLFKNADELISRFVKSIDGIPSSLDAEKEKIKNLFDSLNSTLTSVDPTLQGSVQAETQRSVNGIESLEKKLQAALKKKNETSVNQIRTTLEKAFPAQQPQERYLNFIPFYMKQQSALIEELLKGLKPFDLNLRIFIESEG